MTSVYQQALGEDFERLHPKLRDRYGADAADGVVCVGSGEMTRIDSNRLARPVLAVLARRDLPFPETGIDVPFTIRTYPFEADGREVLVFQRAFDVGGQTRRFDARMTYDAARDCVIDRLGRDGRLVSALHPRVTDEGGLHITAGRQSLGTPVGRIGMPDWFRARVDVREWYDERIERYRISVTVTTPALGFVFGYAGTFTIEWEQLGSVPAAVERVGRPET